VIPAMSRVSRRAGTKALVCPECVRQTKAKPGTTARNTGSFRGRPAAFARHLATGHAKTEAS
jgi:hypothetical protein